MIHHKIMLFLLIVIIIGVIFMISGAVCQGTISQKKIEEVCRTIYKTDTLFQNETTQPLIEPNDAIVILQKKKATCIENLNKNSTSFTDSYALLPQPMRDDFLIEENTFLGLLIAGIILFIIPSIVFIIYGIVHRKQLLFFIRREFLQLESGLVKNF